MASAEMGTDAAGELSYSPVASRQFIDRLSRIYNASVCRFILTPLATTTSPTPGEPRTLELSVGKTMIVGRSSRSEDLRYQEHADNALFSCPVVSRCHAQLTCTGNGSDLYISISDRGSRHGTTVNGKRLTRDQEFELRSGDMIRLGEAVMHCDARHDGLTLRFTQLESTVMAGLSNSIVSYGFSEVEGSEEDEEEDELEDVEWTPQSSPGTNPTSPPSVKAVANSAQDPIDLDPPAQIPVTVINLELDESDAAQEADEDDESSDESDVDDDISILAPTDPEYDVTVDNNAVPSVPLVEQIGRNIPFVASPLPLASTSHALPASDPQEQVPPAPAVTSDPFAFKPMSLQDQYASMVKSSNPSSGCALDLCTSPSIGSSKLQFDPIRNLQPAIDYVPPTVSDMRSEVNRQSGYVYGLLPQTCGQYTDYHSSSRWDQVAAHDMAFAYDTYATLPAPSHYHYSERDMGGPAPPRGPDAVTVAEPSPVEADAHTVANSGAIPPPPAQAPEAAPEHDGLPEIVQLPGASVIPGVPSAVNKSKIAITDIVENAAIASVNSTDPTSRPPRPDSSAAAPVHKRKAEDFAETLQSPSPLKRSRIAYSSRRPSRSSGLRRATSNAAHLATGAVLGAIGTVAFLSSPASEWLVQLFE